MVLPDPEPWYLQTFGALQNGYSDVSAARFGESCDDNAGESAFGTLQLRLEPVPLYELRLQNGDRFLRLFAFVYLDGGFRFVLAPRVPDHFPFIRKTTRATGSEAGTTPDQNAKPIRAGGNVQAARLINRVQPQYPEIARNERLEGTVRLHAIIGKDGAISKLLVLQGYCSLAKASMEAVSKWRYRPTMLLGNPVELDTTIDVIFSLRK